MANRLYYYAAVVFTAGLLGYEGDARAAVLVHVVQNDPSSGDASTVPSLTLPSADFVSPDINFNSGNSDSDSLNLFLNNPVFSNLRNGFDPTKTADNTFLEITAQTFLLSGVNAFVVGHDDGVVLTFANPSIGQVVNAPGATSFSNSPFNVTVAQSGFYAFDLKYTECCGGPANLVFNINGQPVGTAGTPEPTTLLLSGVSLALLAFGAYKAKRA